VKEKKIIKENTKGKDERKKLGELRKKPKGNDERKKPEGNDERKWGMVRANTKKQG